MTEIDIGMYILGWSLFRLRRSTVLGSPTRLHISDMCLFPLFPDANGLTGTLNPELRQLSFLKKLRLQNGAITGIIPDIFDGVPFLEILDLDFNFIGGELPTSVFNLQDLKQLDLNHNRLQGSISTRIGQLRNLDFISVHNNQMTGTIPREIGNLQLIGTLLGSRTVSERNIWPSSLIPFFRSFPEFATFHRNFFEGTMPVAICALPVVTDLTSDCLSTQGRGSPPFVDCDCCTQCF